MKLHSYLWVLVLVGMAVGQAKPKDSKLLLDSTGVSTDSSTMYTFHASAVVVNRAVDNELLVRISLEDGKIEYGPHYTPDEAAKRFWEELGRTAACDWLERKAAKPPTPHNDKP